MEIISYVDSNEIYINVSSDFIKINLQTRDGQYYSVELDVLTGDYIQLIKLTNDFNDLNKELNSHKINYFFSFMNPLYSIPFNNRINKILNDRNKILSEIKNILTDAKDRLQMSDLKYNNSKELSRDIYTCKYYEIENHIFHIESYIPKRILFIK